MWHKFNMIRNYFLWACKVVLGLVLVIRFVQAALEGSAIRHSGWFQLIVCLGAGIHIWHYFILKAETGKMHQPEVLVTNRGLYRWIRHPMYLGDLIVVSGFAIALSRIDWMIAITCGLVILGQGVVEDRLMAASFADSFEHWKADTKRILPFVW